MSEGVPDDTRTRWDGEEPDRPDTGIPSDAGVIEQAFWRAGLRRLYQYGPLGLLLGGVLVVSFLLEMPEGRGGTPPPSLLAGAGVIVGSVSALLLAVGLQRVGAPARAVVAAAGGAACVAIAMVAFGPFGFFEATETRVFEVPAEVWIQAVLLATGIAILLVYVAVLRLVYASFLRRAGGTRLIDRVRRSTAWSMVVATSAVVVVGLLDGPGSFLTVALSSIAAAVVAVMLFFALASFALAFSSTADAAKAAGDVGIYSAVFGMCLAFLVVFQILWIVYILVLATIWPLRTVTPK